MPHAVTLEALPDVSSIILTRFERSFVLLDALMNLAGHLETVQSLGETLDDGGRGALRKLRHLVFGRNLSRGLTSDRADLEGWLSWVHEARFFGSVPVAATNARPDTRDNLTDFVTRLDREWSRGQGRAASRLKIQSISTSPGRKSGVGRHEVPGNFPSWERGAPDHAEVVWERLQSWVDLQPAGRASGILVGGALAANSLISTSPGTPPMVRAVALALAQLWRSGIDPDGWLTMGPLARPSPGLDLLESARWSGDLTPWMVHFLDCLGEDLITIENLIRTWKRNHPIRPENLNINDRQRRALDELSRIPFLSNKDYRQLFGVSNKTAHQELKHLVEKKLVQKTGFGRAVSYRLVGLHDATRDVPAPL